MKGSRGPLWVFVTILLVTSLWMPTPVAAVDDATTTTLTITPASSQYAGGTVTFDVAVTTTSGAVAQGFVAIQTTTVCGTGSPLELTTLGPSGTATLTHVFAAPYEYVLTACFFNAEGTTFGDSQSDNQPYSIVDDATTTTLTITPASSQYAGGTVTFDVAVTTTSGAVAQGFVAIQTTTVCGTGSPLELTTLGPSGTATLTHVFAAPYEYVLTACFFNAEGTTFGDSQSDNQPYSIVDDATTTTLTITPASSQYAGGTVTFDVAVTTTSGAVAQGFVAIQTTTVCGTGSPLELTTLGPSGTATLTHVFAAPYEYVLTACFFNAEGTTFGDSQSDNQPYSIVDDATTTTLTITPASSQYAGGTVTFDVAVTTTSGAVAQGFVAIQTTTVCGTGSPLELTTLGPSGTATLTHVFAAPYEYVLTACFFNAEGTTFGDSQSDNQPYSIVATAPPEITLQPTEVTAVLGETVTFTASATGLPAPTVQWQVWSPSSGNWTDLSGETGTAVSFVTTAEDNGNRYRAIFANGAKPDAITTPATLRLTLGFDGFLRPLPKPKVTAGRSIPIKFVLVDAAGTAIASAPGITARVSLWSSSTGGTIATAGCTFDASAGTYACRLQLPTSVTRGETYWIAAEVAFGTAPWVICPAVGGAPTSNPTPVRIR